MITQQLPVSEVSKTYTLGSVTSKDGTIIGYRQYGHGPALVLVNGAMGFTENYSALAEALADTFTIYVPERRGRGMSPPAYGNDYCVQKDVEDLQALLEKTGARCVYGLSSGALIALNAALRLPQIQKLAIYEPPLFACDPMPAVQIERFQAAIARGDTAAALTAAGKAVQMVPMMKYIPDWLMNFLTNRMLAGEAQTAKDGEPTLDQIAPTIQYDFKIVAESQGPLERWCGIRADVLLLGGGKSPAYLTHDLDALEKVMPHARRINFPDLGHAGSWNYDRQRNPTGNPEEVANELRKFFAG